MEIKSNYTVNGKTSLAVKERLQYVLKSEYTVLIDTDVTEIKKVIDRKDRAIFLANVKAKVTIKDGETVKGSATGNAFRKDEIKQSCVEVAEQIAIGRALAYLGIEIDNYDMQSEEEQSNKSNPYINVGLRVSTGTNPSEMTQKKFENKSMRKIGDFYVYSQTKLERMTNIEISAKFATLVPYYSTLEKFFKYIGEKFSKGKAIELILAYYNGTEYFKEFLDHKYRFDVGTGKLYDDAKVYPNNEFGRDTALTPPKKRKAIEKVYMDFVLNCKRERSTPLVSKMRSKFIDAEVSKEEMKDTIETLGFASKYDSVDEFLKKCTEKEFYIFTQSLMQ